MPHSIILRNPETGEEIGVYYPPHEEDQSNRSAPSGEVNAAFWQAVAAEIADRPVEKVYVKLKGK